MHYCFDEVMFSIKHSLLYDAVQHHLPNLHTAESTHWLWCRIYCLGLFSFNKVCSVIWPPCVAQSRLKHLAALLMCTELFVHNNYFKIHSLITLSSVSFKAGCQVKSQCYRTRHDYLLTPFARGEGAQNVFPKGEVTTNSLTKRVWQKNPHLPSIALIWISLHSRSEEKFQT